MKNKATLDDTLDVFPCHGVGGTVGMIATGIFAADVGLASGKTEMFKYQMLAMVIVVVYSFIMSMIIYKIVNMIIPLRVNQADEAEGLDISQHGETAMGLELFGTAANGSTHKDEVYAGQRV